MAGLLPNIDPDGLLEYSVVYTDRSLNHMSKRFQGVMRDLSEQLKKVYSAHAVIIVPGSGSYGMEAVVRQFGSGQQSLIVRNGYFSFRWSQILEEIGVVDPARIRVMQARQARDEAQAPWAPVPVDEVVAAITSDKPGVVYVPHVETSSGILLPDDYLQAIGEAVHQNGGLFVLDCIASGAVWTNMEKLGVDVLITAPQKGWSSMPSCAMVMLSERGEKALAESRSNSFVLDLKRWRAIMESYETGAHSYHTTMPTMALLELRDAILETGERGFEKACEQQFALGRGIRELLVERGFPSVAAAGFEAPGVVVSYTTDPGIQNGSKFLAQGLQIAAGVPLKCGERDDFSTFRLGLFGLDKLADVGGVVSRFRTALDAMA